MLQSFRYQTHFPDAARTAPVLENDKQSMDAHWSVSIVTMHSCFI